MTNAELLVEQLTDTRDWTLMLLEDFFGDDWTFQPAPGTAHAIWQCGHLASAQHTLIHTRVFERPFMDAEFLAHFPIGQPVRSCAEHDYPPIEDILATMADVQRRTVEAVRGADEALLSQPCLGKEGKPHPHYRDKRSAISHCVRHEAFHAGQIATIRRLRGKGFLR
jgi:uncharacterized damage-inducible protein DinB